MAITAVSILLQAVITTIRQAAVERLRPREQHPLLLNQGGVASVMRVDQGQIEILFTRRLKHLRRQTDRMTTEALSFQAQTQRFAHVALIIRHGMNGTEKLNFIRTLSAIRKKDPASPDQPERPKFDLRRSGGLLSSLH